MEESTLLLRGLNFPKNDASFYQESGELIGYKFVTYPFQTLNLKYRLLLVTKS